MKRNSVFGVYSVTTALGIVAKSILVSAQVMDAASIVKEEIANISLPDSLESL